MDLLQSFGGGGVGGLITSSSGGFSSTGGASSAPQMSIPSLQETMATAFTGPLNQFDPGWQARAAASGMTASAITDMVSSFASGGQAATIFNQGVQRSESAGKIIDDMLAGKISQADQSTLNTRSAQNASMLGMWGGASGGAARGLEARDLGMTQYSLQQMGLQLAGHSNDALLSAQAAIGGASAMSDNANKQNLGTQLAQGAIGLATDWMGMDMQMQAANLKAATTFQAGQALQKGSAAQQLAPGYTPSRSTSGSYGGSSGNGTKWNAELGGSNDGYNTSAGLRSISGSGGYVPLSAPPLPTLPTYSNPGYSSPSYSGSGQGSIAVGGSTYYNDAGQAWVDQTLNSLDNQYSAGLPSPDTEQTLNEIDRYNQSLFDQATGYVPPDPENPDNW